MQLFRKSWTEARRTTFALALSGVALLGCSEQSPVEPIAVERSPQFSRSNRSDAAPASLGWNELARSLVATNNLNPLAAVRGYALLSNAQYGAVTDGDDETRHGNGGQDDEFERGAVAGASAVVLTFLFPGSAAAFEQRVADEQAAAKTKHFGRGVEAGKTTGNRLVAWAEADRFTAPFTGTIPGGPGKWTSGGAPLVAPTFGGVAPYFLGSGNQFRPAPPPVFNSATYLASLAEIRTISDTRTEQQLAIARFWNSGPGTSTPPGLWNQSAAELISQRGLDEREATHVLALMNSAMMDAGIGCWDAKYFYWYIRPSQADPAITTPIGLPNHPSYPSGHSCFSAAATTVLAYFFPREREELQRQMEEAGLSRMYGGIHYDFDIEAGQQLGRSVARYAIRFDEERGLLFRIP